MVDSKCTRCGNSKAHPQTFFGLRVGPLCTPCAVESHQKWKLKISPLLREMRESIEAFVEEQKMDAECKPVEYFKTCEKCEDKLTGHEDESGTLCRWCVTCTDVAEGESIAALKS
jgi:hypothetical protein